MPPYACTKGRLPTSTRFLLSVIDKSRLILCVLLTVSALTFMVYTYIAVPEFTRAPAADDQSSNHSTESQPLYILPTMTIVVLIYGFVTIGIQVHRAGMLHGLSGLSFLRTLFVAPVVWWFRDGFWAAVCADVADPFNASGSGTVIPGLALCEKKIVKHAAHQTKSSEVTPEVAAMRQRGMGYQSAGHAVMSNVWARVALTAAVFERASSRSIDLFTLHAPAVGNSFIILTTIILAVPDLLPLSTVGHGFGIATIVASVLYQLVVFLPSTLCRPPVVPLLFVLCFVHDLAMVIGALSSVGTCGGDSCVSLLAPGYEYDVSVPNIAVLFAFGSIAVFCAAGLVLGLYADCCLDVWQDTDGKILFWIFVLLSPVFFALAMFVFGPLVIVASIAGALPALCLSVPCLSIGAAVVVGFPSSAGSALEHTLLHLFSTEVNAALSKAAEAVRAGTPTSQVTLPPLCSMPSLYSGATAADLHVLRWRAARSACGSAAEAHKSRKDLEAESYHISVAATAAEVAAVLAPFLDTTGLPELPDHIVEYVAGRAVAPYDVRNGIESYMQSPTTQVDAAPLSITTPPSTTSEHEEEADDGVYHVDLGSERYEHALEGRWMWLLRYAWRRRAFVGMSSHALFRAFHDARTKWVDETSRNSLRDGIRFGMVWGTVAAVVLSRVVVFFSPFLEPAFNTNVPTTAYVCLGVRAACFIGLALIAPTLYRTVSRMAAFSVFESKRPGDRNKHAKTIDDALLDVWECIAAAYDAPLRALVPHHVVPCIVLVDVVAPFHTQQRGGAPLTTNEACLGPFFRANAAP